MKKVILAIESSCDETSAAVCIDGSIASNIVATQDIHSKYGGVVPELASRAHQRTIVPVVMESLAVAGVNKKELSAVGFTEGPGLLGALLVGSSFAKSMALSLDIPLIAVNHMHAHILAHFIDEPKPAFPFLCLTVSGGHTQILEVKDYFDIEILGQTKDDAGGEAFDKCGKLMGLSYPAGPLIDQMAKKGDPDRFRFPDTDMPGLDYSFSGIKTAFLYFLQKEKKKSPEFVKENIHDLCASIQRHLIGMLMDKLEKAAKIKKISNIAIAGGVSANSGLREALALKKNQSGWNIFIPKLEYCTDNAAMIAMTAHFKFLQKDFAGLKVSPSPRLTFG